jgi:probable F420-dependent oxidoreductase
MVLPSPQLPDFHRSPTHPFLDPLVALMYLSAHTSRIRLAPGVLLLSQRHPVQLAKELASLDVLSSGRLMVGVGVGYIDKELRALGADLVTRGARTDECLEAMLSLWRDEAPSFSGRFFRFDGIDAYPRPLQPGGPPIMVGGGVEASLRRAVRFGAGWFALRLDPTELAASVAQLHRICAERGRDPASLEVTVTPPMRLNPGLVQDYAEAGAHRLIVVAEGPDLEKVEGLVRRNAPPQLGLQEA